MADLLIKNASHIATMDSERKEIAGGWVAITDGFISGIGETGSRESDAAPEAKATLDATDCLLTPGLVNTHHHLYQNLTRSYAPALGGGLFEWLRTLYPLWSKLNEESAYLSAWVGLLELAVSGCTTSTDHLYIHPAGGGDVLAAEITAAQELGVRFHPTRGSMSLSQKDGGLPPDSVVESESRILEESERVVRTYHDASHGSMLRIALAPCSPFSVTNELMTATAEMAERLDVRLHTHIAETLDEDDYCLEARGMRPLELFESVGWAGDRAWIAHCVHPSPAEVKQLGAWQTGVAHCPSSNMALASGLAPVREMREAGVPVGLGCDGSSSADSGSLWTEARLAYLQGRLRAGFAEAAARESLSGGSSPETGAPEASTAEKSAAPSSARESQSENPQDPPPMWPPPMTAREVLEIATRGGAACLGRLGEIGELSVGAAADVTAWKLSGVQFAGALSDPVEAWLRCGPLQAHHTVIAGKPIVQAGEPQVSGIEEKLREHRKAAERMQAG